MADDESLTPIASSSLMAAEPHAAGDPSRHVDDEGSYTEAAPLPSALRLTSILNASDADVVTPQLPLPTLFPRELPVWLPVALPSPLVQAPEPAPPSRMLQLIERLEAAPLLAPVDRSHQSSLEPNGGGSGAPPPPSLTYNRGAWTADERLALLEGYRLHGRKTALLAPFVPTRSTKQIGDYVKRVVRAEEKQPVTGTDDISGRRVADDSGSEEVTLVRVLPAPPPPSSPLADGSADSRQSTATGGVEEPQAQEMQDKGVDLHHEPPQERPQQQFNMGHWTAEEKAGVREGYRLHGATVSLLLPFVPTRSAKQISNYVSRMTTQDTPPVVIAPDAPRRRSQQVDSHTRTTPAPTDSDSDVVVVTAVARATPVVDLSAEEPVDQPPLPQERRSRRAVHSLKSTDASMTTSLTANNEAIEIHTEESASETPQTKAMAPTRTSSARTRSRDQKPPLASSKAASVTATSDSDSASTATRQRKKSKLTVTIPRHALTAAKSTPESSSTASWTSSGKATARGKKRPVGVEFAGIPASTTPTGTATAALSSSPFEPRECEFCRSSYGVCALVHCALCKRVYHPKCVVRHFQPFCDRDDAPIEHQLAALQLHAPPHVKVKMFRCTSCYAMCVESFRSGVYEWACTCASCAAPEKLVAYRRRMLLHLMYGGGDAKPKTTAKAKDATTLAGSDTTTPAKLNGAKHEDAPVAEVRTGSRRRGRSSALVSESELMEIDSETSAVEPSAVAGGQRTQRDARATPSRRTSNDHARGGRGERDDGDNDTGKHSGRKSRVVDAEAGEPTRDEPTRTQEATSSLVDGGDADQELLASVAVRVDETTGTRSFPIVCTESASLTVSGLMKGGQYQLHSKRSRKRDAVCCDCCSKLLSCEQFVSHTDKNFLTTDGKAATDFLFASHRDGVTYSPLTTFVALLQQRSSRWRPPPSRNDKLETFNETTTKRLSGRSRRLSAPADVAVAVAPAARVSKETAIATASQLLAEAPIVRLRPSTNASSSKPVFLVKLVCLSPRLIIRMSDGVIQSKLDSSTPDQAFPYKAGWLSFDRGSCTAASAAPGASVAVTVAPTVSSSPVYSTVWCSCCATVKSLEDFIAHTGIEDWSPRDDSKFRRHHVFVPQTSDSRTMVEFDKVWQAVLLLHHEQLLDAFLAGVVDEVALEKRDQRLDKRDQRE